MQYYFFIKYFYLCKGENMRDKPQKRYEELAEKLMQKIHDGELRTGDKLPSERYLAKEYGVSRSVVREALRSMERIGCVAAAFASCV